MRRCAGTNAAGAPCRAAPLRDERYCLMHSPEHADAVQEARRLGGLRRRREVTLQVTYDLAGLESADGVFRLLEVASMDTLALENSPARSQALTHIVRAALRAQELHIHERRLASLEEVLRPRAHQEPRQPGQGARGKEGRR